MIDRLIEYFIVGASIAITFSLLFWFLLQNGDFKLGGSIGFLTALVCVRLLHGFWPGDFNGAKEVQQRLRWPER